MNQRLEIQQKLEELKPYLQRHYKVSSIGFFGSFAKNKATKNSDIDLLVEFYEIPGWEYVQLKVFLEKELNRTVDLVTSNALKKQLKNHILKEVRFV